VDDFELVAPAVEPVAGVVVDEDGAPVAGASVGCRPEVANEVYTDRKGRFELPVPVGGHVVVWFRRDGFENRVMRPFLFSPYDRTRFVFKREERSPDAEPRPEPKRVEVRLKLLDHERRPLPGALVRILGGRPSGGTATDRRGRAVLHAPAGARRPLFIQHPGYPRQKARIDFPPEGELDAGVFRMPKPAPLLDFVALDEDGRPIPNACLVPTDSRGSMAVGAPIIPADAHGRIRSATTARGVVRAPGRVSRSVRDLCSPTAGTTLRTGASLLGVVVDAEGRRRSHVMVWTGGGRRVVTDGLGRFRLEGLVPGKEYRLSAMDDLMIRRRRDPAFTFATPGDDEVEIVLEEN
jgi:hypothetical protein